jgi:hypothetical protein
MVEVSVELSTPSLASKASIASLAFECWAEWDTNSTESVAAGFNS